MHITTEDFTSVQVLVHKGGRLVPTCNTNKADGPDIDAFVPFPLQTFSRIVSQRSCCGFHALKWHICLNSQKPKVALSGYCWLVKKRQRPKNVTEVEERMWSYCSSTLPVLFSGLCIRETVRSECAACKMVGQKYCYSLVFPKKCFHFCFCRKEVKPC